MIHEDCIVALQPLDLSLADLVARLRKRESEIDDTAILAVEYSVMAIRHVFEQGDDLLLCKSKVKHGDWLPWLESNFEKDVRRAQEYMKLAINVPNTMRAAYLTNAKSIRNAFELAGILPPIPLKEIENGQNISIPQEIQWLNRIAEFYSKHEPTFEEMLPMQRVELKAKLRPVVKIYERL